MVIAGYLVFGDLPDRWTLAGSAIVIASGLYLIYASASARRTAAPDGIDAGLMPRHHPARPESSMTDTPEILVPRPMMPTVLDQLGQRYRLHQAVGDGRRAALEAAAPHIRGLASTVGGAPVDAALLARLPKLEIIANFGVGYDHIDAAAAGRRGVVVTNTPDVLTEEVADTALGLLLGTVRQLPQAERYLRAGEWLKAHFPLSPSLRDRSVGIYGLGRIGRAIARRLDAFGVPVAYHSRTAHADVPYPYHPDLVSLARDVDTLIVITPGGAGDPQRRQCRGAGRARAARHPDQCRPRLGGRRAGADRGAEDRHHPLRRPRRVRRRAERAGRADRHGQRGAAAARRLGHPRTPARPWRSSPSTIW